MKSFLLERNVDLMKETFSSTVSLPINFFCMMSSGWEMDEGMKGGGVEMRGKGEEEGVRGRERHE